MTDIASLGIKVTTEGVAQAQTDLDKLAASGNKAAASTDKLAQANANAAKKYNSPQYRQQADDLAKLVGQIDPTVAALDKLDKQQAKLSKFNKSGMLSAADFKTYSAAIDEARLKVTGASHAVEKFTLNNSFARRELGRLASDVANGNWGRFEQTSLTLANASGLMSKAFSGVGAMVAVAVLAIGAFAVAAFKGSEEADAFNKALALTGGYAGVTSDRLQDLSRSLAVGATTQHEAAEALAAVAASGKFTAGQLSLVGQAAIDMSRLTGQSAEQTIKQFESLQGEPVKAVLKLNESEHFLTEATYERIKALEESGKVEEASSVAMKARADALHDRAKDVQDNAGTMVRAWNAVAGAAKSAWDAMLNIGRPETTDTRLEALQDMRKRLMDTSVFSFTDLSQAEKQKRIADIDKQISDIYTAAEQSTKKAQAQSAKDQAVQAGAESDAEAAVYATREQKRVQEVTAAHAKANAAVEKALAAGDKATAERIRANEATIVAGINEKYKDNTPGIGRSASSAKADPMAALNSLTEQAYAKNLEDTNKPLNARAAALLAIADAGGKAITKGADVAAVQSKVGAAVEQTNEYFDKQAVLLLEKNAVAMAKYQLALDEANQALERQVGAQIASVSEGDKEYSRQQQINDLYVKGADALRKLQAERAAPGANLQLLDQQIAATQANTDRQVEIVTRGFAQMDRAQADWRNGARRAYENINDQAADVAGQTDQLFTNAFDSMGEALANFATTGKLNFKGLVTSILADLAKMEARILASRILQSIVGSFLGGSGGSGDALNGGSNYTGSGSLSTSWGGQGNGFTANAMGGAYTSPTLSQYSGQIVDTPTTFAFAKGAGLMGEAGPEAILPLQRGADGKLGVAASAGGGGVSLSQTFVVDGSGGQSQQDNGSDDAMRKFAGKMSAVAKQAIMDEQRPGGSLWRMAHA